MKDLPISSISPPHQSEAEQFRLLIEQVQDYAIYMMDPDGRIATWNAGAERIKGYKASEIIGRHYSTFFLPQDVESGTPYRILQTAAREGKTEHEGWRVRKDGSRFWVSAVVTAIRDNDGRLLGFSKITRDVTEKMLHQEALQKEIEEKRKAQEELIRSESSLRQLSLELLRTQDEERKRIGREMHDSIGQYLSALKIKLGLLEAKNTTLDSEAHRELQLCAKLLEESVKEVRTISYLLYPPMLEEMGLKSAIDWYLDGFRERSGIAVRFDAPREFARPSRDVELALFRVLQESLTNVHKHSGASRVDIRLTLDDGAIGLTVRDYGKGMPDVGRPARSGSKPFGVGLRGMDERMRQLGGALRVSSQTPGTLVTATVPVGDWAEPGMVGPPD